MVAAWFVLYARGGYRNQGDHAQRRQAEVDVDVGEQPALGDHVGSEKLERSESRVAAGAAVAVNQIRILRQSGTSGGVEAIRYVQEARGMQRHPAIE